MNQENIGKFIKKLRKDNNLTQKELADKYGVTYQAVSKWENGKNIPDVSLIRQMSKDINISVEDILDGKVNEKKKSNNKKIFFILGIIILIIIIFVIVFNLKNKDSFDFKTISTTCDKFEVSGSIAYDKDKTSIYISKIDYCGEENDEVYKSIECNLYEINNNTQVLISSYASKSNVTLDEYLKDIKLNIDNYSRVCKNYSDESLYLEINALDNNDKIITYKIPLKLNDNCNN